MQHLVMFLAWATPVALAGVKMAATTMCLWGIVFGALKLAAALLA